MPDDAAAHRPPPDRSYTLTDLGRERSVALTGQRLQFLSVVLTTLGGVERATPEGEDAPDGKIAAWKLSPDAEASLTARETRALAAYLGALAQDPGVILAALRARARSHGQNEEDMATEKAVEAMTRLVMRVAELAIHAKDGLALAHLPAS